MPAHIAIWTKDNTAMWKLKIFNLLLIFFHRMLMAFVQYTGNFNTAI
ncbi:hypothetical protein [Okeania sp. SIO2C2]|nr:hypothetical protein [Okeania sp. SIO2C2]